MVYSNQEVLIVELSKKSDAIKYFDSLMNELKSSKIKAISLLNDSIIYHDYNDNHTHTTDEDVYVILENDMCLIISYRFIDRLNITYRQLTSDEKKHFSEKSNKDLFNYDYKIYSSFTGFTAISETLELEYGYIEKIILEPITDTYGKWIDGEVRYIIPTNETFNEIKFIMNNGVSFSISAADAEDDGYTHIWTQYAESFSFRVF